MPEEEDNNSKKRFANTFVRATEEEAKENDDKLKDIPVDPKNYKKFVGERGRRSLPKGIIWGIVGLIVLFIGGSIFSYYVVRKKVSTTIALQAQTLQAGVQDLQNMDPASAEQEFSSLGANSSSSLEGIVGMFAGMFQGGTSAIQAFGDLSTQLTRFSGDLTQLQSSTFGFVANGKGSALVANLTDMDSALAAIDADSNKLAGVAGQLGNNSPINGDFYVPAKAQIEGAEDFLNEFVPWLATSTPHHVLILLQNPSEIRPAGGFLGSYADVTLAGGNITNISVHDVADVDAAFAKNIVPPEPLQAEVTRWRPADANWFFDFPTSASKTAEFFEESGLYAGSTSTPSTTFDTVIAVSPQVISDLLTLTGPVTVPGQSTAFASSTFLVQIQKIVQAGQAKSQTGVQTATYPKKVLGELASAISANLASSTPDEQQQLMAMALNWVTEKDVMLYSSDPIIENFIDQYGASGAVYDLPQNFNGDYLAVVNANILGDKSDLYVSQNIDFESDIGSDGTTTDSLIITRKDTANTSPYWWYQTMNQDYLQIFVPDGSSLQNESGGVANNFSAPINYIKDGYTTDPTVTAIESTQQGIFGYPAVTSHEEDGKEVLATWARVKAGASTEISFSYLRHMFSIPVDGEKYEFIFDKQAGSTGTYKFEINAPLGFVFAENGLATYDYTSNDPPGRLILDLTLQKM